MSAIGFEFFLCRHTRDGSFRLLALPPANSPVFVTLCHIFDTSIPLGAHIIRGGPNWVGHTPKEFRDDGIGWTRAVLEAVGEEIRRLEEAGILPADWPAASDEGPGGPREKGSGGE